MKYRYRNISYIKPVKTNCLIFALWYIIKKGGKLGAEFDKHLCFFHFYAIRGDKEIHYEQKNRTALWLPLIEGRIKIYQLI